jgi:hypothetical protein
MHTSLRVIVVLAGLVVSVVLLAAPRELIHEMRTTWGLDQWLVRVIHRWVVGVTDYASRSPQQLSELMPIRAEPSGLPAGFGGIIALVDRMIHQQDKPSIPISSMPSRRRNRGVSR